MKRLRNHFIGVDQGDTVLFSDFQGGGDMWTGSGQRERSQRIAFSEPFRAIPMVHVSISMWDIDTEASLRADVTAETITREGFDLVFRTWGDTRVARVRLAWFAMGELQHADEWDVD